MNFKYDRKIDIECWKRIIKANDTFGKWFNTIFPTEYKITSEMEQRAIRAVKIFQEEWQKSDIDFDEGMIKIFGEKFPDIICYVNTSSYSMDAPNYISISMERKDPVRTILHEINHFMFRKFFPNTSRIEEVKEIITVINNDVFGVKDNGWRVFKEQREAAFKVWMKKKDVKSVVEFVVESLDMSDVYKQL
jgi:hypothetical protein